MKNLRIGGRRRAGLYDAMGYARFIGARYTRSKKKRSISAITAIAIFGVALGVAMLSIVISVSGGFQDEFIKKVLGVNAHVLVMKYGLDFTEYRDVLRTVRELPEVRGAAPFVIQEMMISKGEHTSGVLLKGVDPKLLGEVLDLSKHIVEGGVDRLRLPGAGPPKPPFARVTDDAELAARLDEMLADAGAAAADPPVARTGDVTPPAKGQPRLPGIVLGRTLAENLEARLGDVVQVTTPLMGLDILGWSPSEAKPTTMSFEVVGVFYAGFLEYDTKLVYIDLYEAQRFFDQGDSVTGVEVTVHDIETAPATARRIREALGGGPYHTVDWQMLNAPLFTALRTQKIVLAIVFAVVIGVAAFNIIATLVMMVFDKRREIAILKSMGASHGAILRIFVYAGMVVGVYGVAIGLTIGIGICLLLDKVGWPLDPKVYLIDHLPVTIDWLSFVLTAVIAFVICLLATIWPSLSAAKLRPVDGLRDG
jgi:lipoprotein-releasing system permease protein